MTVIYIKNMVCNRCKLVVTDILRKIGINDPIVELGKVTVANPVTETQFSVLRDYLGEVGFEIIDDKKSLLIERVKEFLVYEQLTLSEIAYEFGYSSVSHLSKQFKKVTGLTPSHFKKIRENKRKPIDTL